MVDSQTGRPGRPRDLTLPERRRNEILDVAVGVFAARGFAATDVQDIADQVGVGKGTVYRYFGSKRELFLAAADRGMQRLSEAVHSDADQAKEPLGRLTAAIHSYLAYFDEHPDLVELLIQERAVFKDRRQPTYFQHRDANLGPWRELFRELIREGQVRDIPVSRITDIISDLLYGTIFTNHFANRRKRLATQANDVLDILFHGILAEGKA